MQSFNRTPHTLIILTGVTLVLFMVAVAMVFFYAPTEAVMGPVQRIFYFHVASMWTGMLGFLISFAAGIAYLRTRNQIWDITGVSAVEIGLVFTFIGVVSGSIWARPTWNTWWTWDPRLTTTAIMEIIYLAYFMLRNGIDEPERRARFGAVYSIVGFISVPLTFFSIRLFRTIHPLIFGNENLISGGNFEISARMLHTLLFSLITFTFLFGTLLWHRIRIGKLAAHITQLQHRLEE